MEASTATETLSDEEVVSRVLRGEKGLFELIIRRHNERLFRISRSYVRDDDEAEDIMQEAYVKAYEQLPRFEGRSQFATWLIRILINEALARVRRRQRMVPEAGSVFEDKSLEESLQAHERENPDEQVMTMELRNALEKAIDDLPDHYRQVYVMREVEHLSVAETASCLGITETNVKVRVNRAKEMLRRNLEGIYGDTEVYGFHLDRCNRIVRRVLERVRRY